MKTERENPNYGTKNEAGIIGYVEAMPRLKQFLSSLEKYSKRAEIKKYFNSGGN